MKTKILLTLLFITLLNQLSAQQLPYFNHYVFDKYLINPAYTGQFGAAANFYYKNQWVGVEGTPQTHAFNIQGKLRSQPLGFGFSFYNDVSNVLGRTSFTYTNSYKVNFGLRHELYFGLSIHLIHNRIYFNKLVNFDENEPILNRLDDATNLEGSFGLGYRINKLTLGFSSDQLFQNGVTYRDVSTLEQSTFKLLRHYSLFYQYDFRISDNFKFVHSSLLRTVQGLPAEYEVQGIFTFREVLFVGGSFSSGSNMGLSFGLKLEDTYFLGYQVNDHPQVRGPVNGLTHEIALSYWFGKNEKTEKKALPLNELPLNDISKDRKLDYDQQKLNELALQYEALQDEINSLKRDLDSDLDEESRDGYDKYYVVTGTFSSLRNARLYQKVFYRETGIETKIEREDRKGFFLVYSGVVANPKKGKKKIRRLLRGKSKGMLMGNPWLYKKDH